MGLRDDLTAAALASAFPGRQLRSYPALLSTEADALAWARAGAPSGAVVAAGYQAAPRGRGGRPWTVDPARGVAFSTVLRPQLPSDREGWLYIVATLALSDVLDTDLRWPDQAGAEGSPAGATGMHVELGADRVEWAVVNLLVVDAAPPRPPLLAALVAALECRLGLPTDAALADYRARCATLGRRVRARLIPLGPAGAAVEGIAVDVLNDGALVVETATNRRVAVPPRSLGILEDSE